MELAMFTLRMTLLLMIAFCSASVSFTITTTSLFKYIREKLSTIHPKVEEWIHCPWCFNHWIVAIILLVAEVDYLPITPYVWFNFLFTMFVLTTISGLIHNILLKAYEPVAKAAAFRAIQKAKEKAA